MRINKIIAAAGAAAVIGGGAVACGSATYSTTSNHHQAASSSPTSSAPAGPSADEQTFTIDMRQTFSFGSDVSDQNLIDFGHQVCSDRQSGTSLADEIPTVEGDWSHTGRADSIKMIKLAEQDLCPAETTGPGSEVPKPPRTVLLNYTGSGNWNSQPFHVRSGAHLVVTYWYSGNTFGDGMGGDNFIADVTSSSDDLSIANDIATSGGKTTRLYPDMSFGGSHRYHLEVEADNQATWHFKIVEVGGN